MTEQLDQVWKWEPKEKITESKEKLIIFLGEITNLGVIDGCVDEYNIDEFWSNEEECDEV